MFAKFAIAATAAVLAAAIALPAGAQALSKQPIPTSTNMSALKAPPVSLPSQPTSGTMNMPPAPPKPAPAPQPAPRPAPKLPPR